MTWRQLLIKLAERSAGEALAVFDEFDAGAIGVEEFVGLIARGVTIYNLRATGLADVALAGLLTARLKRPVLPVGIEPPDDLERLTEAARTLNAALDATPDPRARVARLARSEPLTAAQRAYGEAMAASPHVSGWRRGLSPAACQLCRWWARDGRVFPADHPMPHHKGCTCTPIPITEGA